MINLYKTEVDKVLIREKNNNLKKTNFQVSIKM